MDDLSGMSSVWPTDILVIGDGDLSYSTALSSTFRDKQGVRLTATTLDSLESLTKRYKRAEDNIKLLSSMASVSIYYGVDARELETFKFTKDRKFHPIVFNFPHPGGKNCMATNRKLLSDFFMSAEKVLRDDGEIWLTLCDGQGGTPADKQQREWQNSWQVVGMAAKANVILTRVEDFNSQTYLGYQSKGYRSTDRGFATAGALTHVFVRGHETVDDHVTRWQSLMLKVLRMEPDAWRDADDVLWAYTDSAFLRTCRVIPCDLTAMLPEHHPITIVCERLSRQLSDVGSTDIVGGNIADAKDHVHCVAVQPCVVQRQCMIGKDIEHQPVVFDLHGSFRGTSGRPDLLERVKLILSDDIGALGNFHRTVWVPEELDSQTVWKLILMEGTRNYELCAVTYSSSVANDEVDSVLFAVFLSRLVLHLFGIMDARLLLSSDSRFWRQFETLPHCRVWGRGSQLVSIYPCSFKHDVGFWTREAISDLKLSQVIRSVTGDIVESESLINVFRKDDKTGLCYRIVYQSCDKALSETEAGKLQLAVREALVKEFGVELR